jgi:hypothetical protein
MLLEAWLLTFCGVCNLLLLPQVTLLESGYFTDNVVTHLVAGLGAGFFAVCVGSPVDVVKSRVMGEWAAAAVTAATAATGMSATT